MDSAPEVAAEVELETDDLKATAAENLQEIQPPVGDSGIQVDDMDGSPDDELEVQTGVESLSDTPGDDVSSATRMERQIRPPPLPLRSRR